MNSKSGGYSVALPELSRSERMLPEVWAIQAPGPNGRVEDVEALCAGALVEVCRRQGKTLAEIDGDDSLRFLLGEVVVLYGKYDPAKRHGSGSFAGYLYDRLRFRLIDYWRTRDGRNGEKRVISARGHDIDNGDSELDRSGPPAPFSDDPAEGTSALPRSWTDAEGDRGGDGPFRRSRLDEGRRAA